MVQEKKSLFKLQMHSLAGGPFDHLVLRQRHVPDVEVRDLGLWPSAAGAAGVVAAAAPQVDPGEKVGGNLDPGQAVGVSKVDVGCVPVLESQLITKSYCRHQVYAFDLN